MNLACQKVKKLLRKLLFLLPSSLPIGMNEFNIWADSIIQTYDFPDNDSLRFALATMILHLESNSKFELNLLIFKVVLPTSGYKSKFFFVQALHKGASNQVASGKMQELKQLQEQAMRQASEPKSE